MLAQPRDPFTQLWLVPAEGETVRIGFHSEEGEQVTFRVVLANAGGELRDWRVDAATGSTWEQTVVLTPSQRVGAHVLLYRGDETTAYRSVALGPVPSPSQPGQAPSSQASPSPSPSGPAP